MRRRLSTPPGHGAWDYWWSALVIVELAISTEVILV